METERAYGALGIPKPTPSAVSQTTTVAQSTNSVMMSPDKRQVKQTNIGLIQNQLQQEPVQSDTGIVAGQNAPTKEWHVHVKQDLRNHLVHKLVQAIFPAPDPAAYRDKRMKNLVDYARKVFLNLTKIYQENKNIT